MAITVELYALLASNDVPYIKRADLAAALDGFQAGLLSVLADRVAVHGYYRTDNDGDFLLNPSGVDLVMSHVAEPNADIAGYFAGGVPWILQPDNLPSVPAIADADIWEPLPIDRGNEEFQQMLMVTESAIQQVEANNGYADSEPEERNGIVSALRGAVITLKEGMASKAYVRSALLAPLNFIAKKFSEGLIGQIAKSAAEAVLKWISNF